MTKGERVCVVQGLEEVALISNAFASAETRQVVLA